MNSTGSLVPVVEAALARTRRARALEAGVLGATAALFVACAIEASAADAGAASALFLELLVGALCAATWWFDHRRSLAQAAQRADERLGQAGALWTAFDAAEREHPLRALLAARVLARLPADAVARAAHRAQLALLAAPLAALAGLLVVREHSTALPAASQALVARAALSVARAARAAGAAEETARELEVAAGSLTTEGARSPRPEELRGALERADALLADELAKRVEPESATADELDRRALLEAARDSVEAALAGLGASKAARPRPAQGNGSQAKAGDSGLKSGVETSTMEGSAREPATPATTVDAPPTHPGAELRREAGTTAGRWWPREYDDVVSGWLEARRGNTSRP